MFPLLTVGLLVILALVAVLPTIRVKSALAAVAAAWLFIALLIG